MRLRLGIIGAGTISQVEHIPNAVRLSQKFDVRGVADPSAISRRFISDTYGIPTVESVDQLLQIPLDAVIVGSPDPLHHEQVLTALGAGLHVFCEKPLCYGVEDIDEIASAQKKAGKVVQVGYMKRFDPNYQAAIAHMPAPAQKLRYISVEVNDPDAWPFIRHHVHNRGTDIPAALVEDARAKQSMQVKRAVKADLDRVAFRGFTTAYCSSLVHDVNAVHGLLDALSIPDGDVVGAQIFAGGDGGQGAVRLLGGQAMWNMCHLTVPALADYRERISLYFDDAILELEFPSPWLNHQPTRLTIKTSEGHELKETEIRAGFEEAFINELEGFWDACVNGAQVRNPVSDARRDQALLCALAERHAKTAGAA